MVRYILPLSFLFIFSHTTLATCKINNAVIGAKYKITTQHIKTDKSNTRYLLLWRNNKQVAQQLSDTGVTEVWEKTNNGLLRLVRYFDKHHRGIEYQPNEINNGKGDKNWDVKSQLIADKLIKSMHKKSEKGKVCENIINYTLKTNNKKINLNWLTQQNLIKTYSETSALGKIKWELIEVTTDKKQINNVFSIRSDYQTTDYADIGDNESDPFLMKMINLGFVEHAADGFYDTNGNSLKGHHRH